MARIFGPFCGNVLFGHGPRLPYLVSAALLVPAFVMVLLAAQTGRDWSGGGALEVAEPE